MTDRTTIAAGGRRLEVRWAGPSPEYAPSLVLLHEGLGCAGLWRDFPEKLAQATGFGVCAYSRAGYGGSDSEPLPWPTTYMEDHATRVLPEVLDAIGFRRGLLVGHSDGASIAAYYAGAVSDRRVQGAVLMAPHFFVEDICIQAIRAAKQTFEEGDLRSRLERHHGTNVDNAFYGWNGSWLNPAFVRWHLTDALRQVRIPLVVLQGLADPYGTRAQADVAVDLCPASVTCHLLEGIGHAPWREAEAETLAAIKAFAARLL